MKALKLVMAAILVFALAGCSLFLTPKASVQLVNNSSFTVYYVYISPSSSGSWGSDWLNSTETIVPGDMRVFTGIEPGTYDLEARWSDNISVLETTLDVQLEGDKEYIWAVY
jgi:hypothetical protein